MLSLVELTLCVNKEGLCKLQTLKIVFAQSHFLGSFLESEELDFFKMIISSI